MDWDKLRIFHAVAEAGSFTHAGETLNLSQSAVSRQISTLEDSLSVSLFHRHARGLMLTEEGEILHKAVREVFGRLAMIEGQLSDSKELPEGSLTITVADFIGSSWLGPKLAKLKEEHPGLQMTINLDNKILNLGMREADAAIRLYKPEEPDLIQRHLTSLNFHICASKTYLAKHGTPTNAKELRDHILIGYPENAIAPFIDPNWLFRVAGIDTQTDNNVLMINSLGAIYQAVNSGCGISCLPDYMIEGNKNIDPILPDVTRPPVDMYFVYPEERKNSKRIGIFRDFLLKTIKT